MEISATKLRCKGACKEGIAAFKIAFGEDPVTVTRELCETHAGVFGCYWDWVADNLLPPALQAEYDRAAEAARAEYDRAVVAAWAEYGRAVVAAWAERNLVMAPARAEYDRAMAPARAERDRVRAMAWVNYDLARAGAFGALVEGV